MTTTAKRFLQIAPGIEVSHSNNRASVAYNVARENWPKLISSIISTVKATSEGLEQDGAEGIDAQAVIHDLEQLCSEIESDGRIPPLPADGNPDIEEYNAELATLGPITWHNSPWLYTECYLFRRIWGCFARRKTEYWREYAVWAEQKEQALKTSRSSILELLQHVFDVGMIDTGEEQSSSLTTKVRKAHLTEMLQVGVWGNSADLLSLLTTSAEDFQSRQGAQAREMFKKNVVVDDTDRAWDLLEQIRSDKHQCREIHIVLDNAGFELISDLVVAIYLLHAGYADHVTIHGKLFPWYVSDATERDLDMTLRFLASSSDDQEEDSRQSHDESTILARFTAIVASHLQSKSLEYTTHPFWTTAHPYARLADFAPDLYEQLCRADLVIFKGDVNYRKLVFAGLWAYETPFETALGKLSQTDMRILALRTCKGDSCVGLSKDKVAEIDPESEGTWTRDGKFGVIALFDGNRQG